MELDILDKRILGELMSDSRQTNSQIAKKLNKSQQIISYRIKQLINKKIITEFFTVIHFSAFGLSNYTAMVKFEKLDNMIKQKILKEIYNTNNVLSILECGGKWDIIINMISDSYFNFEKEFQKILNNYTQNISSYDLFATLGGSSFGRKYLYNKNTPKRITQFGHEKKINITNSDLKILKLLSKNSRISALEMEKETGLHYKTIIKRIKDLIKNNIISGFRVFVDITKLGYNSSKIYLDINKLTTKEENNLTSFLSSKSNIIGTLKMIGKWNFAITLETKNQEEIWQAYKEIQEYLGDKISSMEIIPIFRKYEYKYFPEKLLKNSEQ